MNYSSDFLAFDLGAESGRAILGTLDDNRISLRELTRFPTGMLFVNGHYRWNIYRFYEEMLAAMSKVSAQKSNPLSVGFDTWGVDFALLAEDGSFLDMPVCYRDPRTNGMMEAFFQLIPREEVYQLTGIQFMQLNTLFQLYSLVHNHSPLLRMAAHLLFVPDIFHYLFTGVRKSEFTFATTSQLFNPRKNGWETNFFDTMNLPVSLMQEIVQPGTFIGHIKDEIGKNTGLGQVPVVAVATHDTGSAIAAVPAKGKNWAYISSGTWSLMGIESTVPLINEKTYSFNLTNEGGVEHTFRVLKNIMGLWLIQQCRAAWGKEKLSYGDIVELSKKARPFSAFIDPDAPAFLNPPNMPAAIIQYCRSTNQNVPEDEGSISRIVYESLALKYRFVLDQLREIAGFPIETIFIIGGGVQNEFLCQCTADACGIPVVTGPSEGTALGNIMVQALAAGKVGSRSEIREIIRNSFQLRTYEPLQTSAWEDAYEKFKKIVQ
ncbi:MAG: rhamnulokinase [Bacteroidales bacterium]